MRTQSSLHPTPASLCGSRPRAHNRTHVRVGVTRTSDAADSAVPRADRSAARLSAGPVAVHWTSADGVQGQRLEMTDFTVVSPFPAARSGRSAPRLQSPRSTTDVRPHNSSVSDRSSPCRHQMRDSCQRSRRNAGRRQPSSCSRRRSRQRADRADGPPVISFPSCVESPH